MNKKINFEDNFFLLAMRIRMIQDTVTLEAAPELFLEKIIDDISFTGRILQILLGHLEENLQLFERDELLRQLFGVERQFYRVLEAFRHRDGVLSTRENLELSEKLEALSGASLERQKTLGTRQIPGDEEGGAATVNSAELSELLKAL